jgi:hypothetical protein
MLPDLQPGTGDADADLPELPRKGRHLFPELKFMYREISGSRAAW